MGGGRRLGRKSLRDEAALHVLHTPHALHLLYVHSSRGVHVHLGRNALLAMHLQPSAPGLFAALVPLEARHTATQGVALRHHHLVEASGAHPQAEDKTNPDPARMMQIHVRFTENHDRAHS